MVLKVFNHVHVQKRGFTKLSVFLKRASLLNPRVRPNFMAFPLERTTGKSLEVRFDFGPRPGFSKQLFGSSREGTEWDWTYFYIRQFLRFSVLTCLYGSLIPWLGSNASLFTKCLFTIFVSLDPPPSQPAK